MYTCIAACALHFFPHHQLYSGTGIWLPKPSDQSSGARPPAGQGVGPSGLASLVPPSQSPGLTGLASMVFQQHRRAGRPPKPPATQPSSGRATPSRPQLPVLSNPHGPASFPYFKEGFMTQPFRYVRQASPKTTSCAGAESAICTYFSNCVIAPLCSPVLRHAVCMLCRAQPHPLHTYIHTFVGPAAPTSMPMLLLQCVCL